MYYSDLKTLSADQSETPEQHFEKDQFTALWVENQNFSYECDYYNPAPCAQKVSEDKIENASVFTLNNSTNKLTALTIIVPINSSHSQKEEPPKGKKWLLGVDPFSLGK